MAQAATGQLGNGCTAGSDEGSQRQGDLVTDSTGGVLVDGGTRQPLEAHSLAGLDHRRCPGRELLVVQTLEEHRHGHGGHLFIGDDTIGVCANEPTDLIGVEGLTSALGADEVEDGVGGGHAGKYGSTSGFSVCGCPGYVVCRHYS